jgi:phage tail sheath protein FI
MPEYLYPGVYVEEIDTGNQPIEGVSTSIAGFLGIAERGPLQPTLVTSYTDFVRTFGGYVQIGGADYYLAYGVEGFFLNGGQEAFIARVATTTAKSATEGISGMGITAIGPGTTGNQIFFKITAAGSGDPTQFKLYIMYYQTMPALTTHGTPPGAVGADAPTDSASVLVVDPTLGDPVSMRDAKRTSPTITEVYDNVSANPNATSFCNTVVNNASTLVTLTQIPPKIPANTPPAQLTGGTDGPGGGPSPSYPDGSPITLFDFQGDPTALPGSRTGIAGLNDVDEISLLCCPDENLFVGKTDIANSLVAQCELRMDRFAILQSPFSAGSPSTLIPSIFSKYAAFYYPWMNITNPLTGRSLPIPPGAHVAGIYARSDNNIGVHKDPANEPILGIDSLQFNLDDGTQAILNPRGVDCLRYFRTAGNLVWGGRTTTSDPDWKYINVRRLFIFIEKSIKEGTQWAVFEPNDSTLWARITRSVKDFLTGLWKDGMLMGDTAEQAFFVKCDTTTMTQADIENGRLIVLVGIAPVYPAEFVIFRIGLWDGGASVSES